MASKISWTEETWNPVVGCTKCSPGCENCYAEKMARRLAAMNIRGYRDVLKHPDNKEWLGVPVCMSHVLDKPLHWRKPRKIFVCSMSDLFHPKVPFEFIDKVYMKTSFCSQHTFQVLTKRPDRMLEYHKRQTRVEDNYRAKITWPIPNLHLGATICNQKEADEKIPLLLQIPASVRFVSIEPMLEGIDLWWPDYKFPDDGVFGSARRESLDWVIVGAESGPKRRECKIEWVESVVDQCTTAGVPCFVKQIHKDGKLVKMPKDFPQENPND